MKVMKPATSFSSLLACSAPDLAWTVAGTTFLSAASSRCEETPSAAATAIES